MLYFHYNDDSSITDEVFVFGSNLAGRHGKGAALAAVTRYNAQYGKGIGYSGYYPKHSYAIPTKNEHLVTLSLYEINRYVKDFLDFASNSSYNFFITRIGCGLAGYKDSDIAMLFKHKVLTNCIYPVNWREYLLS